MLPAESVMDRRLIMAATVLVGVGGALAFAGMAIGSGAVLAAGRRWMQRNEVHPRDLAMQTWRQTKEASRAGAQAWRSAAPANAQGPS